MLTKVQHLRAVIEANLEQGSGASGSASDPNVVVEEIDQQYIFSMIKGFGILGKLDDMRTAFNLLKQNNAVRDHRCYDEMLRWYAFSNNVKEVMALKDEMSKENVYHSAATFQHVFRVLDKHYPRMVEKYYEELQERRIPLDSYLYAALIRVFSEVGDTERLDALHEECRQRVQAGQRFVMSPAVTVQLMRAYRQQPAKCEQIIADAKNYGHMTADTVQAEVVQFFSDNNRHDEMIQLVEALPRKSHHVYRVLLRDAVRRNNRTRFDAILKELRQTGVVLSDRLFGVIVGALGHFHDATALSRIVSEAKDSDAIRHSHFFADAATAYSKVRDWAAVDDCWHQLLESKLSISMSTYNRFLDVYMSNGRLDNVQAVLNVMMKNVPPNPITATTVIDMLGKMGRLSEMEALLTEMVQSKNALPTLVTYHQVMNAYAKAGDIHKLEAVRHQLHQQGLHENHVTYNILAEGYGRAKRLEHLQDLIAERRVKGIAMEEFGYVILLHIYSRSKMYDEARALVAEMEQDADLAMTPKLLCVIASAFSYIGDAVKVDHYVTEILKRPERSVRDIETVYLIYSRMRDVRRLQQLLEDDTLPKSQFVYNVAIGAFAKAGEHTKVALLLQQMELQHFSLTRSTAVTLSSLLLKAGKLQLAQAVLDMNYSDKHNKASSPTMAPADTTTASSTAKEGVQDEEALLMDRHNEDVQQQISPARSNGTGELDEDD